VETAQGLDPLDLSILDQNLKCIAMLVQAGVFIKEKHIKLAGKLASQ